MKDSVSKSGSAITLLAEEFFNVQGKETLLFDKSTVDCISCGIRSFGTCTADVNNSGFDEGANVLQSLLEISFGVNYVGWAVLLQEGQQSLLSSVVVLDFLGKNGWRDVVGAVLTNREHTLLADILGAVEDKYFWWFYCILDEEFSLEFWLREVLNQYTRACLSSEVLDQSSGNGLIVSVG